MYVGGTYISYIDAQGDPLGHPPLHIHHLHVGRNSDVVPRNKAGPTSFYAGWALVAERHGDTACAEEEGGTSCLLEQFPPGSAIRTDLDWGDEGGKRFKGLLSLNSDVNDVRAAGSPQLEWWLEASVKWTATPPRQIINRVTQASGFNTYPVPYHTPSLHWHTLAQQESAEVLAVYTHTHHTIFDSAWVFRATPEQLGLNLGKLQPNRRLWWDDFVPAEVGFKMSEVKKHILYSLDKSRELHDTLHESGSQDGAVHENRAMHEDDARKPEALCKTLDNGLFFLDTAATRKSEHGLGYDRQSRVLCKSHLHLVKGEVVTFVFFNRAGDDVYQCYWIRMIMGLRKFLYYAGNQQHSFARFVTTSPA
ncbi:hypothetical protein M885DRAFT_512417, partial [Pelagophyceae sp. CCMP2097]